MRIEEKCSNLWWSTPNILIYNVTIKYILSKRSLHLQESWENLAKLDPYWSVLSDSDKIDNGWDLITFYSTGKMQIEKILTLLKENGIKIRANCALDYGCGVGRLSEALAGIFLQVIGVDFSQNMINLAEAHNVFHNLTYKRVNGRDLLEFSDKTFDLVISLITLQHTIPKIQYNIIREMSRVIKDDGVIILSVITNDNVTNYLRNAVSDISPKIANFILSITQKLLQKKIGHFEKGISAQIFSISKRKLDILLKSLHMNYIYLDTADLNYQTSSKLEIYILFKAGRELSIMQD